MEVGKMVLAGLCLALLMWLERDYRRYADRLALYEEFRTDGLNAERAAES